MNYKGPIGRQGCCVSDPERPADKAPLTAPSFRPGAAAAWFALALAACGRAGAQEPPEKLTVLAQVRSPNCYVGQTVDLFVGVAAGREAPRFTAPDVPGATLRYAGTDMKPLSVGGIGDTVFERSMYRARYRLVPRRPGALTVPPFTARVDGQKGTSDPVRLTVRKPPEAGRPAEFLGGVGRFEVEAKATPTSVRSGQTLDYEVTVTGPAARGVASPPDVSRLERLPAGFRVERRPDVVTVEPPSHTFIYRLRPTRAGDVTLPPVRVAMFDPTTSRYLTKATPGVPVRVTDVPRFDPSSLDYGTPQRETSGRPRMTRDGAAAVLAAVVVLGAAVVLAAAARQRRRAGDVRRLCRETVDRIGRAATEAERGRIITEGLIAYLGRVLDRPPGALTPADARDGIARANGTDELARRAEALIARCDAACYASADAPSGDLAADGRLFFQDLEGLGAGIEGGGKTR